MRSGQKAGAASVPFAPLRTADCPEICRIGHCFFAFALVWRSSICYNRQKNMPVLAGTCVLLPKQPTPRKGTETADFEPLLAAAIGNNLHPARGRKLSASSSPAQSEFETTYTPQGDGNPFALKIIYLPSRNNLHPARGRKRTKLQLQW